MSTVKSTEGRIFNFSIVESALMVCMAGLQVFIVRFFFQGARKGMSQKCCEPTADHAGLTSNGRVRVVAVKNTRCWGATTKLLQACVNFNEQSKLKKRTIDKRIVDTSGNLISRLFPDLYDLFRSVSSKNAGVASDVQ